MDKLKIEIKIIMFIVVATFFFAHILCSPNSCPPSIVDALMDVPDSGKKSKTYAKIKSIGEKMKN